MRRRPRIAPSQAAGITATPVASDENPRHRDATELALDGVSGCESGAALGTASYRRSAERRFTQSSGARHPALRRGCGAELVTFSLDLHCDDGALARASAKTWELRLT